MTVGSLLGEVLGIKGYLGQAWFWIGHQGWEYLELGRLWQILMFLTGLLPIGLLQVWTSYDQGFWFARSAAFYEMELVQKLGNWRIVPDTIIIVLGAFSLLYFLLSTYPRLRKVYESGAEEKE